jgi:hypothetical protein
MVSAQHLIAALAAATLAACAPPATQPPEGAVQEHIALLVAPDTRTVLASAEAQNLTHQCSRVSPGPVESAWTPSTEQLDALDNDLAAFLAARLQEVGSDASPGDYHRQMAGFVIDGRRVVYVNGVQTQALALSSNSNFDWRTQAVQICDGGPITFGVEYDPATRQFANFAFNGAL